MSDTILERTGEYVIGMLHQIPPGEGRTFDIAGLKVAVFRTRADAVFATQAHCPHRAGPLADGMLGGATIICPLHERSFDLRTGQELGGECSLTTYPVRLGPDGGLTISLPG